VFTNVFASLGWNIGISDRGVILYTGAEVIPFANNLHGVPITHLWAR
jgi:hypothetical protein